MNVTKNKNPNYIVSKTVKTLIAKHSQIWTPIVNVFPTPIRTFYIGNKQTNYIRTVYSKSDAYGTSW